MTETQIIKIILSSSLLSAGLTGFITWLIKKYDYKKEYYREIIKKRMFCYENIENFLGGFVLVVWDEERNGKYYNCLVDRDSYANVFIKDLGIALKFSMWINDDTRKILIQFNEFTISYGSHIMQDELNEKELIQIAISSYPRIQELRDKLNSCVMNDLRKLHKLEFSKFMSNNNKSAK